MEKIASFIEVKYVMAFCLKRCRMMKEGEKERTSQDIRRKDIL